MCGLAALISATGGVSAKVLADMCQTIAHRGPDGEGFVLFDHDTVHPMLRDALVEKPSATVGFGHRRLSILDVSEAGHQPMSDPTGRFWITYNGEIYNHLEIRSDLEQLGITFKTHSDTEIILAAWAQWGRDCLERFNGMFSFVLYDREKNRLVVVRDRFGVKPLYYFTLSNGILAVASEIKAFTVLPDWQAKLNGQRAYDFLVWGISDHTNETLFEGVYQLRPGHLLDFQPGQTPKPECWYRVRPRSDVSSSFEEASEEFHDLFMTSVRLRLRADVSVGTALSGGLDSSSIVCAVHQLRSEGEKASRHAFSARSSYADFDEGEYMQSVVDQTHVDHHETWPDADGLLTDLDKLIWHHDEPFSSASIFAEWKVFETVANSDVKVTLDGHGADETLAGYTAFIGPHFAQLARRFELAELKKEWAAQRKLHKRSHAWMLAMMVDDLLPAWASSSLRKVTGKTHTAPSWLSMVKLAAHQNDPFQALGGRGRGVLAMSEAQLAGTSLPMQLKWADRDSMAHSIESREPFLDHNLVEFILGAQTSHKLHRGVSKRLLRAGLKNLLPEKIANRRDKMGFVTPEELWVTKDRPDDFQAVIEQAIVYSDGLLREDALKIAKSMTSGNMAFHTRFIRMMTFGLWMKRFNVQG